MKKSSDFRDEIKGRVWSLLEDFKGDPSFANQCVARDRLVTWICDSVSSWGDEVASEAEDESYAKERWIAR